MLQDHRGLSYRPTAYTACDDHYNNAHTHTIHAYISFTYGKSIPHSDTDTVSHSPAGLLQVVAYNSYYIFPYPGMLSCVWLAQCHTVYSLNQLS